MPEPETQTYELRTDTVELIIDVLETGMSGGSFADTGMTRNGAKATIDRLERQTSRPDAVAFCGLPGAGKSYTAEKAADVYDVPVVSMGDAIREEAPPNLSSEKLGDYAAQWRNQDPEGIPEKVAEIAGEKDSELVIIDGVRSTTDYEVLSDYFDDFYLIRVEAEFYTRLSRLQERGREGEAKFDAIDLAERDEHERENLGFGDLIEMDYPDISMKNGTGPDHLNVTLKSVVQNNLPFEVANRSVLYPDEPVGTKLEIQPGGGPVGE